MGCLLLVVLSPSLQICLINSVHGRFVAIWCGRVTFVDAINWLFHLGFWPLLSFTAAGFLFLKCSTSVCCVNSWTAPFDDLFLWRATRHFPRWNQYLSVECPELIRYAQLIRFVCQNCLAIFKPGQTNHGRSGRDCHLCWMYVFFLFQNNLKMQVSVLCILRVSMRTAAAGRGSASLLYMHNCARQLS